MLSYFIGPPSPPIPKIPACALGTFGCCWDNATEALGDTSDITQSQCARK